MSAVSGGHRRLRNRPKHLRTSLDNVCGTADEPGACCSNGTREAWEACDDGNTQDGDYCASDCSAITTVCGDGRLKAVRFAMTAVTIPMLGPLPGSAMPPAVDAQAFAAMVG